MAVVTGVAMVAFEIVEISVVGFSLVDYGIDEPVAWLQVVYIVVGSLTAGAGSRCGGPPPTTASGSRARARPPAAIHG